MNYPSESESSDPRKPLLPAAETDNEEALRQSEEKYRTLFNSIDQGCYLADVIFDEQGLVSDIFYLDANAASTRMTGQDFTGKFLRDISPAYEPYWYEIFGRVAKTGQSERMHKHTAPDRILYDFFVFAVGSSGHRIGVIFQDVSDRARREVNQAFLAKITSDLSQLSTAEEIMATVGAKIGEFLAIKSCLFVDVDDSNGLVTVFDGWNAADVPVLRDQTLRLSDFISDEFSKANRIGEGVVMCDTTTDPRSEGKDYSALGIGAFMTVPFLRNGSWTNYLAVTDVRPRNWRADEIELFRDLSNRIFPRMERARAEEYMHRIQERIRIAVEAADMATWEWNLATDEVFWNEQHFCLLGIPVGGDAEYQLNDPLPSDAFLRHVHPHDLDFIKSALMRAIEEKIPYDVDFRIVRTDGTVRWMSGYGRITAENDGRATRFSGVMFDIHEQKQAEEALIEADRHKDEFLATLAHELRNPLAPIRNMLQILHLTVNDDDTVNSVVGIMTRQVNQLVRLVDDLLDVSRISRGTIQLQLRQIDFNEVIHQAIETASPLYEDGGRTLMVSLPAEPVLLQGDTTRLIQVVNNLLNNAAKFTYDGGGVELKLLNNGTEAFLTVSDNGIGIVEHDLERIFELFTQSDASLEKSYGGLGVGLTLVRQLVELHGGRVTASSQGYGLGSIFKVQLPVISGSPENAIRDGK